MADSASILVVDERNSQQFLGEMLSETATRIDQVYSSAEALDQLQKQSYDLVIVDLYHLDSLAAEFVHAVQTRDSRARVMLVTAYDYEEIGVEGKRRQWIYDYVTRAIRRKGSIQEMQREWERIAASIKGILVLSDDRLKQVTKRLSNLRTDVGASGVIMATIVGGIISQEGEIKGIEAPNLVNLAAIGLATSFEMSSYFQEKGQIFDLNYHEGEQFDVYSGNIGSELFVTILFERSVQKSKIGTVWYYLKQALEEILQMVTAEGLVGPALEEEEPLASSTMVIPRGELMKKMEEALSSTKEEEEEWDIFGDIKPSVEEIDMLDFGDFAEEEEEGVPTDAAEETSAPQMMDFETAMSSGVVSKKLLDMMGDAEEEKEEEWDIFGDTGEQTEKVPALDFGDMEEETVAPASEPSEEIVDFESALAAGVVSEDLAELMGEPPSEEEEWDIFGDIATSAEELPALDFGDLEEEKAAAPELEFAAEETTETLDFETAMSAGVVDTDLTDLLGEEEEQETEEWDIFGEVAERIEELPALDFGDMGEEETAAPEPEFAIEETTETLDFEAAMSAGVVDTDLTDLLSEEEEQGTEEWDIFGEVAERVEELPALDFGDMGEEETAAPEPEFAMEETTETLDFEMAMSAKVVDTDLPELMDEAEEPESDEWDIFGDVAEQVVELPALDFSDLEEEPPAPEPEFAVEEPAAIADFEMPPVTETAEEGEWDIFGKAAPSIDHLAALDFSEAETPEAGAKETMPPVEQEAPVEEEDDYNLAQAIEQGTLRPEILQLLGIDEEIIDAVEEAIADHKAGGEKRKQHKLRLQKMLQQGLIEDEQLSLFGITATTTAPEEPEPEEEELTDASQSAIRRLAAFRSRRKK